MGQDPLCSADGMMDGALTLCDIPYRYTVSSNLKWAALTDLRLIELGNRSEGGRIGAKQKSASCHLYYLFPNSRKP